jgi:hypothetical protein
MINGIRGRIMCQDHGLDGASMTCNESNRGHDRHAFHPSVRSALPRLGAWLRERYPTRIGAGGPRASVAGLRLREPTGIASTVND